MKINARFIRTDDCERQLSSHDERMELATVLGSAPGIAAVEVQEAHLKGGYRTRFELLPDGIDAFASYLKPFNWRFVT